MTFFHVPHHFISFTNRNNKSAFVVVNGLVLILIGPMVSWVACSIFTAAIGVRIPVVAVKFHNVYDYTIERHSWQVSENHKPLVHPSHVREIG